jgi:thiamine kinase-like enzyme
MEKIESSHPFLIKNLDKAKIISKIIDELENLHKISSIKANLEDMYEMYVNKTLKRIEPVTKYLNLNKNSILVVNNIRVEPILPFDTEIVEKMYKHLSPIRYFTPIHGDPTFSNIFVSNDLSIKFIDPRGSFGKQKIYGDPRYDFAKLYYSAIGNYDQFNLKNFRLKVDGNRFTLSINSSGFEETEIIFRTRLNSIYSDIKILHALIWLSLSGYVIDDIDAMVAAYVHGLELTRRCIDEIKGL